ncbi:hypothetical protein N7456_012079 [Penicillium angulare]|uniref:Uncharacterized protein n=1 Tax=Penicillium angulare TaxID=116970 RepID=A0A9W9EV00_9EURO|nr:hypothetical protein N7456_012079 [Penicillium angulare]
MTVRATRRLDGDDSDAFPRNEDQEFRPCEQRLYWSCLKSETELAHEYGLETSTIGQLTDPPSLPTPPDPLTVENILTSMFITTPSDTTALAEVQEKSWYYYLTEITLRKLEIQIHASFERLHDEEWPLPIETMSPVEKTRLQDFLQCIISGITEFETQLRSCWERLGSAMDIDLNDVTIGCPDELAEYLRIKFYWIKHDLLRIALTIILYFESTSASTLSRGESSLSTEFPSLSEVLFGMANRGLVVSVTIMQVAMNTHRNHGSWFGPMIAVMGALEVIAARRFEKPGLVVPWQFEDAAKSLVDGLKWWEPGMPDAGEYLKILASLDPVFEHGY